MQEPQVLSLDQEDPLEKEMATPPVFLLGKSHGQRSLVGYSSQGHKELDTTEDTEHARLHTIWNYLSFTRERGNFSLVRNAGLRGHCNFK